MCKVDLFFKIFDMMGNDFSFCLKIQKLIWDRMKTNCDRLLILFFLPKTGFKTLHLQRAIFMSDLRPYLEIWRLKRILTLLSKWAKFGVTKWKMNIKIVLYKRKNACICAKNARINSPLQTKKRTYKLSFTNAKTHA